MAEPLDQGDHQVNACSSCPGCGVQVTRRSSACISHCPARESYCYRQMLRSQALANLDEY